MTKRKDPLPPELPGLLLAWYDGCARVLPWREDPTPYRVWVSEIMLQQTRVEAVKPYYERFLRELPTVEALADAPEEQLLKLWEGLGYYNRVRNLQKGARQVMDRFGGRVPASFEDLRSLAGVGEYTAGAIASIAFGIPVPAVDGNVLRVVSRVTAREDDILDPAVKKRTEREIAALIPKDRAGDFNQSLMELGAMVCLPNGAPKCEDCPLKEICLAHREGIEETLPVKAPKKPRKAEDRTVLLLTCRGKAALVKRPEKGLLAGMWELPGFDGKLDASQLERELERSGGQAKNWEKLPSARHVFTHVEWRMDCWAAEAEDRFPCFVWAGREELEREIALPSAFRAWTEELRRRVK